MEAAAGFEPANNGFANRRPSHAKTNSETTFVNPENRLASELAYFAAEIRPTDPELAELLTLWPALSPEARRCMLATAEAVVKGVRP